MPAARKSDDLDAAPPAAFVRTRNALAARLRAEGRTKEAAEIAARRRPSPVVWAVNRLARTDPSPVRRLLESTDRLRRAQLRDPRAMPAAVAEHREAVEGAADRVRHLLADADVRVSPEVLRRVHATLTGAAADRGQHAALRQGRLAAEVSSGGFDVFRDVPARHLSLVPPAAGRSVADRARASQRRAEEREEGRAAERREAAERRAAKQRTAEAARRQRRIDLATRRADTLRRQVQELERRIEAERRAATDPASR